MMVSKTDEVAVVVEMLEDRGMGGGELL